MAHYIIYFECIEGFKNRYAPLFLMFTEKVSAHVRDELMTWLAERDAVMWSLA